MDSWPIASTSNSNGINSIAPDTPSRASRTKGTTNHILYSTFSRTLPNDTIIPFSIGDAVVISALAPLRQKWLLAPDSILLSRAQQKGEGIGKGKGKGKVNDKKYTGWSHEDGFKGGERVAIILGFYEDESETMMVRLRWFARPGAVWGEAGPDEDEVIEPFELYYTADSSYAVSNDNRNKTPLCTDSLPISFILEHALICTPEEFNRDHSKRSEGSQPAFQVKKVYDAKPMAGAEFMGEIDWMEVLSRGLEEGDWDTAPVMEEEEEDVVYTSTKKRQISGRENVGSSSKKRKVEKGIAGSDAEGDALESDKEEVGSDYDGEQEASSYATPPRKGASSTRSNSTSKLRGTANSSRRRSLSATPAKKKSQVQPKRTQNAINKAALQTKKRKQFKGKSQPGLCGLPPAFTTSAAFEKLNVFEKAKSLLHVSATPEFLPRREEERTRISSILGDAILSQSGTCLFIAGVPGTGKTATVHSVVRELQQDEDMDQFQFVEINGMKLPDPSAAFSVLWRALSGEKSGTRQALASLENHFQSPDPTRKTTVVLVDELDQMFTKKQEVIYNFFNWPHVAHSRLIVIAIANTINLPETLPGKVRSRLGSNSIAFEPYSAKDLEAILSARILGFVEKVFEPNALSFLGRKVAGALGDARRALDVARRIVEKVDQENRETLSLDTKAKKRLCSMQDVNDTYREMTEYGSSTFVKQASLQQKVLLLALSQCIKRAGIPEVPLGDVLQWHLDFLRRTNITPFPSQSELFTLVAELHSLRLLGTESQREDYYQRVRSTVENGTLFEVLKAEEKLSRHVPKI